MSVQALSQADIREYIDQGQQARAYECAYCGGNRGKHTSVRGSYCSWDCYDNDEREKAARDVLRTLAKDHRYCRTCFRKTKVVETPDDARDYPDAVCGYQYPTPDAEEVWRDKRGRQATGLGCTCGNCQHSHADPDVQRRYLVTAVYFLTEAVATLQHEDKLDHHLDREQLFQAAIDTGAIRPALEVAIQV
ncbi:hypothetical protein [Halorarum salinum]|uniref:Uncharacterized protein n=1 Tax=Halorarum salinum TaxID=2743089 RepID=A0A7D5LCJ9_9EURY|nr:hypothetical protein [Halobaculum salinum]QLG62815.1 hypothetical protein HUG12_14200 [Halobaculum salinum]